MKNMDVDFDFLNKRGVCRLGLEWLLSKGTTDFDKLYELAKQDGVLNYANWYITKLMSKEQLVEYAVFAAESVIHIWENYDQDDNRPQLAIQAAMNYLNNQSSHAADAYAAGAAAYAAGAAAYAAAAYAAHDDAAAYAAGGAAYAAGGADAADAAAYAADAADAANYASRANDKTIIKIIDYGIRLLKERSK